MRKSGVAEVVVDGYPSGVIRIGQSGQSRLAQTRQLRAVQRHNAVGAFPWGWADTVSHPGPGSGKSDER